MKYTKEQQQSLIDKAYELNEITFHEKQLLQELNENDDVLIYKVAEQHGKVFRSFIRAAKMFRVGKLFEKEI